MSDYIYRLAYRASDGSMKPAFKPSGLRVYVSRGTARSARSNIYRGKETLVIQRVPADQWETVDDVEA